MENVPLALNMAILGYPVVKFQGSIVYLFVLLFCDSLDKDQLGGGFNPSEKY